MTQVTVLCVIVQKYKTIQKLNIITGGSIEPPCPFFSTQASNVYDFRGLDFDIPLDFLPKEWYNNKKDCFGACPKYL